VPAVAHSGRLGPRLRLWLGFVGGGVTSIETYRRERR
jgi:hypothetical protein